MTDQTETLRAALLSLIEVVETHTFHLKRWGHEQSANYLAEQAAIAREALATPPAAGLDVKRGQWLADKSDYE